MPRFSVKEMVLATTLVAFGLGMEMRLLYNRPFSISSGVAFSCAMVVMVAARLLAPFHENARRVALGAGFVLVWYAAVWS